MNQPESILAAAAAEFAGSTEPRANWCDRVVRQRVLAKFERLEHGVLHWSDPAGSYTFGRPTEQCSLRAAVRVHDIRCYRRMAAGGSLGAGAAYIEGLWSSDDLVNAIRIAAANANLLSGLDGAWTKLAAWGARRWHAARENTLAGSRRNIAAHYDLGEDFYGLFLDETMTYSAAWFPTADTALEDAQRAKYDRICRMLDLRPGQRVLEIGTGWGGFAVHAAQRYGCQVTTTTISRRQYEFAKQRVAACGLEQRVTVLEEDYRVLRGKFDKIVSIEMIEAVGAQYYDSFFRVCAERLESWGALALQAITVADRNFESARRSVDFIKRFVFPGCCIPSVSALFSSAARSSDLTPTHLDDLTPHYAKTLRTWRRRFWERVDAARALGMGDPALRLWDYYLAYCESGFLEREIASVQMMLVKPRWRAANGITG